MSTTIDQRVVEMRFDNKQFESATSQSMSTIEKLKRSLNFKDSGKSLESLNSAAKKVDMSGLGNAVDTVRVKFSSLEVMATTALANITNSAVNAGKRMISALTLDPVIAGFQEYETQINSVQTILANTQSKGSTLEDVTAALDELNAYADQTIYNFTEMTRNIGTFTAAGVDLDKSVTSIKGIANLAAISGSNATQASTAMYQLSQALAAGRVSLMDWNSVVNAGMGGEVFQTALKRTATQMGYNVDALIEKYGSFRESLTEGQWLTAEVLTETLTQLSGAYTEADLIAQGYSESQAKEIVQLAETAVGAATDVKTLTQLFDTLGESLQSGWTQSWEIILGDFEEAKALFSEVSEVLGNVINESAESRNNLLQGWKDLGGRTALIDSLRNAFEALVSVITPITEAFREIFPPTTAEQLFAFTEGLRDFTAGLKLSDETSKNLKSTFKGLFAIFDIVGQAIKAVFDGLSPLFNLTGELGGGILGLTGSLGDYIVKLNESIKAGEGFSAVTTVISDVVKGVSSGVSTLVDWFGGLSGVLSGIGGVISKVFGGLFNVIGQIANWVGENISVGDIFAGLAGGGIFLLAKKFIGVIDQVKEAIEGLFGGFGGLTDGVGGTFTSILESVHDSLESFAQGIQVASLVGIAVAVTLLSSSLRKISEIEPEKIAYSLATIAGMIRVLNSGFNSLAKTLAKYKPKGMVAASVAMIAMAEAINILASAMQKLADLDLAQIAQGLIAIEVMMLELTSAIKRIGNVKINLRTSVAIIALAQACKMLSEAMAGFAGLSWEEIARGLVAMGGALTELVASLTVLNKVGGFKSLLGSVGILIIVQSLDEIATALADIGALSWEEIGKGLAGMGGALGELVIALGVLSKVGGFGSVLGGTAILIVTQSLDEIAAALADIGALSWEEIGKGLAGMGGALTELSLAVGLLGKLAGFSGLLGGGAILIAVQSLDEIAAALADIGALSWEEIGRGLVGMGGALAEVSVVTGLLGKLAGFSGLLGGGSILLAVQGLGDLADAFAKFGGMSWDEIGRGLVGMGGALTEVAAISGILGTLTNVFGFLGSGTLLLGIQGLDDLASALQRFGSMSWDEIGRGLSAMGGALGEVALGGLLNTFSGLGAGSIMTMAEPLGVLADSIKKWAGVKVPEDLGASLSTLAVGVGAFVFKGWGADAIATIAAPMGTLADSIMKWSGVSVPEGIGTQLQSLADGVGAFTWKGWGADTLATTAPAMGQLADAVAKWSSIDVPTDLEEQLTGLANGVQAFTWAFAGGWSMNAVIGPLGELAGSVSKWSGVKVPDTLEDNLTGLANGVLAFSWAFMGGFSIWTVVGPLGDLSESVKKWNGVTVPEGLEDGLTSLSNGVKAFTWAFVGGYSMGVVTGPLGELAESIKKWNGVSVPEGLEDGLTEIANGTKAFTWAFVGGYSIGTIAAPLGTLADSMKKWKGVSIPDGLGDQLDDLAGGVKAFNFSGWGAEAIAASTTGVGNMADSVRKWRGVTVPEDLGDQLKTLAKGVKAFNSSETGAEAIAAAGTSLGDMASSVKKWENVTVPEDLGQTLSSLAKGISSFNFSGWGAEAIAASTTGVGNMATSVKKWEGVTVPDGLEDTLRGLANGVRAFNFSGWGADAIEASTTGVGNMATAVKKWDGVTVPEGMEQNLVSLANGVRAFNFSGWGADAMEAAVSSISGLADAVDKWSGITVPDTIGEDLSNLASGVKSFTFGGWGADTLNTVSASLSSLADAIIKLSGSDLNISILGSDLTALSVGVSDLSASGLTPAFTKNITEFLSAFAGESVTTAASNIDTLVSAFGNMASIDLTGFSTFQTALNNLGEVSIDGLVTSLQNGAARVGGAISLIIVSMQLALSGASGVLGITATTVGTSIAQNIIAGTQAGIANFSFDVSGALNAQATALTGYVSAFKTTGVALANGVIDGFTTTLSSLSSSIPSTLGSVSSAISSQSGGFESSGIAIANSLISGVSSRSSGLSEAFNTMITNVLSALENKQNEFKSTGQTLMTQFIAGVKAKEAEAKTTVTNIVTGLLTTLKNNNSKFKTAGTEIVKNLVSGIESEKTSASTSFNGMITSMVSSIRSKYTQFYNAGGYLVQGFANGISSNTYLATAKAQAMADAADTAARNALGVHSPSTVFYSVGEYVVQGFVNGISDNTNKVEDSGETLGTSMLDATKDALDVESDTSELAKKVIGETFVNGIAEGIEEDMSAEEAAAKKAENIVTAFSNALEKIDLSSNKLDLEQQLWDSVNENVTTDAQKDAAKLQTLLKEYEYQQQRIELAKAEYDTMVKEFGESSQDAKESYNKYLQEQIDLADLSNQIIELKDAELEREKDILDKRDEMIEYEYSIWKNQNEKTMTEQQEAIADLALLTQQYANQKQRVSAALSNYHAILSMFGSDANETYEAYNEYLSQYQEQTDMFNELIEARETALNFNSTAMRLYNNFLNANKKQLLAEGLSMEEIYDRALKASAEEGRSTYDVSYQVEQMNKAVESAISSASKIVGTNYMTTIEKTFGEEIAPTLTEQGENMAAAIGEGLQNGSEIIAESTKKLMEESTSKIETAATVDTFANMGKSVASSFVSGIQSGLAEMNKEGSQLSVIGQTLASSFISSISMSEVSVSLVTNLAAGIEEQDETMTKAFEFLMALMVEVAKDSQNDFKEAGKYVVVGFANGISANTFLAQAQARAMANAAYQAAMEALDAHSPSKLFMQVGSYVPLGFAQGIRSAENAVTGSAASMADAAIQTTKDTISRIVDVINSDVDTQPTIRPVFDLSEVETGAKRLNAMFSRNQAMSISSSMTNRTPADEPVQNGDTTSGKGVSNTFIQNNYSPKALSRVEIYRQTKNQFSAFERVTKA